MFTFQDEQTLIHIDRKNRCLLSFSLLFPLSSTDYTHTHDARVKYDLVYICSPGWLTYKYCPELESPQIACLSGLFYERWDTAIPFSATIKLPWTIQYLLISDVLRNIVQQRSRYYYSVVSTLTNLESTCQYKMGPNWNFCVLKTDIWVNVRFCKRTALSLAMFSTFWAQFLPCRPHLRTR